MFMINLEKKLLWVFFVTDEFNGNIVQMQELQEEEKYSISDLKLQPNLTWVAAVEECPSVINDEISNERSVKEKKETDIKVYRVNRNKKGSKEGASKSSKVRKTLRELKQNKHKATGTKPSLIRIPKERASNLAKKCVIKKYKRKCRRLTDKSYRPSSSLKLNKLKRMPIIILFIVNFTKYINNSRYAFH